MKARKLTTKYDNSDYVFVKCDCCNMAYYRRLSTIRGNDPLYYNKHHYKRFQFYKERKSLTKKDLRTRACKVPGICVVWRSEDPQPFILLNSMIG
jgi:hypothetical protein